MTNPSGFSRRDFLKTSVLAAAAAPLILPAGLHAGANDKITLGFIGVGKQGRGLMHGFLGRSETQVLAVCDVDTTRRESAREMADKHYKTNGSVKAYGDFRELLGRKDIDGVVIATPDHWHAITAIAAADAGKDIYCEKPMSHSIEEGRAMVKATRRNQRVFQVGSMQRSSREFRVASELIRNKALGKISRIEVAIAGPAIPCDLPGEPLEPGLDWNFWLGPAPERPYNSILSPRGVHDHFPDWRNYREYGGGGVTDWGAHHFDIAQWALGYDDSGPAEFFAAEDTMATHGARFRYDNGVEVIHVAGNGITFFGEKGKLYVNRGQFQVWLGNEQKAADVGDCDAMAKELLPPNAVRLYNSGHHLADWLGSMRSRKPPICDVEVGARTAAVCNLVNLTYYYHQSFKWDPARETFTDGTGNPKWLKSDFRKPWKLG